MDGCSVLYCTVPTLFAIHTISFTPNTEHNSKYSSIFTYILNTCMRFSHRAHCLRALSRSISHTFSRRLFMFLRRFHWINLTFSVPSVACRLFYDYKVNAWHTGFLAYINLMIWFEYMHTWWIRNATEATTVAATTTTTPPTTITTDRFKTFPFYVPLFC